MALMTPLFQRTLPCSAGYTAYWIRNLVLHLLICARECSLLCLFLALGITRIAAACADFGYVGGAPGKIDLYVGKEVVRRGIPMSTATDELIELIKQHGR